MIVQPEIGILGFMHRRDRGVSELLVQDKFEPGNSRSLQTSCTVQATPSNFMRVHGGAETPMLSEFRDRADGTVLADRVQSEQGSWYLDKRNRNMVVEAPDPQSLAVPDGFQWLPLDQIGQMVRRGETVNMNARSVLSAFAFERFAPECRHRAPGIGDDLDALRSELEASRDVETSPRQALSLVAWFHDWKAASSIDIRRVPLPSLPDWKISDMDITHRDGRYFAVIGCAIQEAGREVDAWMQPMIEPTSVGTILLLLQMREGSLHALLCARTEPCLLDGVELGPTVQLSDGSHVGLEKGPPLVEYLSCPPEWVVVDAVQTEDGGRFMNARTRNLVVLLPEDHDVEHTSEFRWASLAIVGDLLRHGYRFNVEARSLFSCLL